MHRSLLLSTLCALAALLLAAAGARADPVPDYIHIMGPDQVDEDDCFDYGCRLYWSDGSWEWIDPIWSVSPDTYASINQDGVLCTTEVDEDQQVTITAEYTVLGIDLDAEKLVTIVDLTSPLLESIEIIGNGGVPEGEGAQYYCRANYDDGSQAVVDPIWSVDPDDCVEITVDGYLITYLVDENEDIEVKAEYTEGDITKYATMPVVIFNAPQVDDWPWIEPSLHIYFTVDMDPASFNSLEDFRVLDSANNRVGDWRQLTWPDLPDTTHAVWTPDDQLPYGKYQAKLGGSAADIFGRLLGDWDLEFWPTYVTPHRRYVKAGSVGGDGKGWATALGELQDALAMARADNEITEIWVAAGTYTPDPGGVDRERSFELVDGVAIYGHFGGFESTMDQRDLDNPDHITILSGDLLGNDGPNFTNYDDNSRHIMTATAEITEYTILDGFTIEAGGTTGDSTNPWISGGSGILCDGADLVVRNCLFTHNLTGRTGGALYSREGTPTIEDSRFEYNEGGFGAALNTFTGEPRVRRCAFIGNESHAWGGAIANQASLQMENCLFLTNTADLGAGAISDAGDLTILNCTFGYNTGHHGGAIHLMDAVPGVAIDNCIFWGNHDDSSGYAQEGQIRGFLYRLDINYSIVQGWDGSLGGLGNLGDEPNFVNEIGPDGVAETGDENLRLCCTSPGIDAGDNDVLPIGFDLDLDCCCRCVDDPNTADTGHGESPIVDMGAFEFQNVCPGDLNGDDRVDISDLGILLASFGALPGEPNYHVEADINCDGDVGLADLGMLLAGYGVPCP